MDVLELVSVCVYLKLTAVVVTLQGDEVNKVSDSATLVFPARSQPLEHTYDVGERSTNQVADVTLGILSSGGIAVSSMLILERCPAFSSHSRECATTVEISTSPPK